MIALRSHAARDYTMFRIALLNTIALATVACTSVTEVLTTHISCPRDEFTTSIATVAYYDDGITEKTKEKVYLGNYGEEIQFQRVSLSDASTIANQLIYDAHGRLVLETLPAPTGEATPCFDKDFIKNLAGESYSYSDFDRLPTNSNLVGERNNPAPVAESDIGTLGWYYSDNNDLEPYVPSAVGFPYSRIEYDDERFYGKTRSALAGIAHRMGRGRATSSVSQPIESELDHYSSLRHHFINGSVITSYQDSGLKTTTIDNNGNATSTFTDLNGNKLVFQSTGLSLENIISSQVFELEFTFSGLYSNTLAAVTVVGSDPISIFDADDGTLVYSGPAASVTSSTFPIISESLFQGKTYIVSSKSQFVLTHRYTLAPGANGDDVIYDEIPEGMNGSELACSMRLFWNTSQYSAFAISPNVQIQIIRENTGPIYTGESDDIPIGILTYGGISDQYIVQSDNRFVIEYVDQNSGDSQTRKIKSNENCVHSTYYYFDDAANLVAKVPPLGVDASSSALPQMFTRHFYNSAGWRISTLSPDSGVADFVYKSDGLIRFSQSAEQRSRFEFSYTNYDKKNRPTESGVYESSEDKASVFFQDHTESRLVPEDILTTLDIAGNAFEPGDLSADGLDDANCREQSFVLYDISDQVNLDAALDSAAIPTSGYQQSYLIGRVSHTYNRNPATNRTWYSYDDQGRVRWVVQQLDGLGAKTTDYEYNQYGQLDRILFQKHSVIEQFEHRYQYDADNRLLLVKSSRDGVSYKEHARYNYYRHGPLKRIELGKNLQGIDYTYTVNDWPKTINHPLAGLANRNDVIYDPGEDGLLTTYNGFFADVFGLAIDYHQGDYVRQNSNIESGIPNPLQLPDPSGRDYFNGNIKSLRWRTNGEFTPANGRQWMTAQSYDNRNWLVGSIFGEFQPSITLFDGFVNQSTIPTFVALDDYRVSEISYDGNGNLLSLKRDAFEHTIPAQNDVVGSVPIAVDRSMDRLEYHYDINNAGKRGNNLLRFIDDRGDNTNKHIWDDIRDQKTANYVYDQDGRLLYDVATDNFYIYDKNGLVIEIRQNFDGSGTLKVRFTYDEAARRIRKQTFNQNSGQTIEDTWYVRDVSGKLISIFEGVMGTSASPQQTEFPLYGLSRLGVYKVDLNRAIYELTDHVGNVRAAVSKTFQDAVSTSFEGDGPDDWRWSDNNYVATLPLLARTGTQFISLNLSNTQSSSIRIDLASSQTASVTFHAMTDHEIDNFMPVRFRVFDAEDILISTTADDLGIFIVQNGWTEFTASFQAPQMADGHYVVVDFQYLDQWDLGGIIIDDVGISISPGQGGVAALDLIAQSDFYPFGMKMPGHTSRKSGGYRYTYQGKETDLELNLEDFGSRFWNSRNGRWSNIDPAAQFNSPYLGMGNNPISILDVDGTTAHENVSGADGGIMLSEFETVSDVNNAALLNSIAFLAFSADFGREDMFDGDLLAMNIRMYTAAREAATKAKNGAIAVQQAQRQVNDDNKDIATKTGIERHNRIAHAKAEKKLAKTAVIVSQSVTGALQKVHIKSPD